MGNPGLTLQLKQIIVFADAIVNYWCIWPIIAVAY